MIEAGEVRLRMRRLGRVEDLKSRGRLWVNEPPQSWISPLTRHIEDNIICVLHRAKFATRKD